jgi:nucleolar protein 4
LRKAFAPYGPIHSISIPNTASLSSSSRPRGRGFAFVWFLRPTDAEKAITGVNGKRIWAGMGLEREEKEGRGRMVAVDWALSKDEWHKAEAGQTDSTAAVNGDGEHAEDEPEEEGDEDIDEDEEDDDDDEEEEEDDDSDLSPVEIGAEMSEDEDDESDEERPETEPQGTTLFVRNVQFEATEAELYEL